MDRNRRYPGGFGALVALAAQFATACAPPTPDRSPAASPYPVPELDASGSVVAVVGPVSLTTGELSNRIRAQTPFIRRQLEAADRREAFVEQEIQKEILAQEAWRRGLHRDPQVVDQLKQLLVQRLVQDEMKRLATDVSVSERDVKAAYEAKKDQFMRPAAVRLERIVRRAATERERATARRLLGRVQRDVRQSERKGERRAFQTAIDQHSEATEALPNDGFVTRKALSEQYGETVAQRVFEELQMGQTTIVDAPEAVILFRKSGTRRAIERRFEQVEAQLRGRVLQERRLKTFEAFVERLKRDQNVRLFLDRAKDIQAPKAGGESTTSSDE